MLFSNPPALPFSEEKTASIQINIEDEQGEKSVDNETSL